MTIAVISAFLCGFWERLKYGDSFGRTHETNMEWNEAYDRGANLADFITRKRENDDASR